MYIFIDEAGTFQVPTRPHQVSCVAALVVPEAFAASLFRRFRSLSAPWRVGNHEIKGSELDEDRVASVIRILRRFDVLVVATCIDMGLHSNADIEDHRNGQADAVLRSLRDEMHPDLRADIKSLADRTRRLSKQLYAQFVTLTELVAEVFQLAPLYYVQRIPGALGAFKWRIDAKNRTITSYERAWLDMVGMLLQTRSFHDPFIQMEGADYSAFRRFEEAEPHAPRHLAHLVKDPAAPFLYVDIKKVLTEDLRFVASHRYCGVQLADIVATTIRRACNGNLQPAGWRDIGKLSVQRDKDSNNLRFLSLTKTDLSRRAVPYAEVVRMFDLDAKRMVTRGPLRAAPKSKLETILRSRGEAIVANAG